MTIYVPVGFILFFMAIYLFREYNRVKRAKQEERRESLHSARQAYLDSLIKPRKKDTGKPSEETDSH